MSTKGPDDPMDFWKTAYGLPKPSQMQQTSQNSLPTTKSPPCNTYVMAPRVSLQAEEQTCSRDNGLNS